MGDSRKSAKRKLTLVLDDLRVVLFYGMDLLNKLKEVQVNKRIFKKWWFWVIVVVIVLGAIGAATQPSDDETNTTNTTNSQPTESNSKATLPALTASDYTGKEGLVVYKELKAKGYTIDADFEKQALTDINGKASSVFEPLDVDKSDDRQSVDAFVVGSLAQDGDSVKLVIVQSSN